MEKQEHIDRLGAAVGEADVLYTLYWIKEMKTAGVLEEGLPAEREFSHCFVSPPSVLLD